MVTGRGRNTGKGYRAPGHLPYRAGIWQGLERQDLGSWREKCIFHLEKRWEGDLGVRCSEFRILPLFPVCLVTLGEWFAPLKLRSFSCRIESILQGFLVESMEEGMGCV